MFRKALLFTCESVLVLIMFVMVVLAQDETPLQVTNQNRSGDLPFSTSIGSGAEQVDVASGNLKVRIPIVSIKGRGLDYNFALRYDTAFWAAATRQTQTGYYQKWNVEGRDYLSSTNTGLGWTTNTPWTTKVLTKIQCSPGLASLTWHYIYTDSEGAKHPLFVQSGNDCINGVEDTLEPDASYAGLSATLTGTTLPDGTATGVFTVDSNGNQETYGAGGKDTLGRTIVTAQPGTNQLQYQVYDSGGTLRTYTVTFVDATVLTSFGVSGLYGPIQEGGGGPNGGAGTRSFVTSIMLPNGRSYGFQYETGSYGGITRIDLPTGAYVTYTWGTFSDRDRTHRYVTNRTVHVDSQTYSWTISRICALLNAGYCKNIETTVTDPENNQSVYVSQSGDVISAKIYQGSAVGTPLRQYAIDYQKGAAPNGGDIGGVPILVTTTLDNGQVSKTEFDYEWFQFAYSPCSGVVNGCGPNPINFTTSRGNVTEVREYGWGQGTPGSLIRRTKKTYLHDPTANPNTAANYLGRNIVDKVLTETICDGVVACVGNGDQAAQTQYEYDNYVPSGADANPLLGTTNAAQHDYTNFSTSFIYRGNATRVKRWRNTDSALLTTTYQYDDLGNIRLIRDPLTHTTSFSYTDSFANSSCAPPTGKSGQAWVSQVTNALSQLTQVVRYPCTGLVQAHKDQNDITASRAGTTYTYDLIGRTTQKNFVDGGQVATSYNDTPPASATNTTKIASLLDHVVTSIQDGLGRTRITKLTSDLDGTTYTRIGYDGLGRKSQEWNPTRCDPDVNPSSCTGEPTFGVTTYTYDGAGRITYVIPPDGSISANNVATRYSGNTTTVTDQAGKVRKSQTDALGRLTAVWEDPNGVNYETDYQYNVLGNLWRVDQKGTSPTIPGDWRTRQFTYDSLSRLQTASNPESGLITYTYDLDGNVTSKQSPKQNQVNPNTKVTVSYCYDFLHRLTSKVYAAQSCPLTSPDATYSYDQGTNGIGRRTAMTDSAGSESWSYDSMGRVASQTRITSNVTKITSYTYNLDSSIKSITYPSTRVVNYTYNGAGRPLSAIDSTGPINYVTAATYAPQGALYRFTNGSSISGAMTYNSRLQPLQQYLTTGTISSGTLTQLQQAPCPTTTAVIMSRSYNFGLSTNDNGNVSSIANCRDPNRSQNFTYDALNRIQQAYTNGPNWGETFGSSAAPGGVPATPGIDAWGNLWQRSQVTGKNYYEPLNAPALTNNRLTGFGYDAAGNMTSNGTDAYTYDPESRITKFVGLTTNNYSYDGDGQRVKKTGPVSLYWYGATGEVLDETSGTGALTSEYIFFNGKRVARRDADNSVKYDFADHLGSASVVTSSTGTITEESDYYPYGGEIAITNTDPNHYKFTGKERDAESNLDYFGARHYGSALGRFMTPDWSRDPDPVPYADYENPQTLNLYQYVENNPLNAWDPDGHAHWGPCPNDSSAQCWTGDKNGEMDKENRTAWNGKSQQWEPSQPPSSSWEQFLDWRQQFKDDWNRRIEAHRPPPQKRDDNLQIFQDLNNLMMGMVPISEPLFRDITGKVHGDLPDHVPDNWSREDLEQAQHELRESIKARNAEQSKYGEEGGHRERIRREEQLLRQVEKKLGGS